MASKQDCCEAAMTGDMWYDSGLCDLATHASSSRDLFLFIFAFQDLCASPKSDKGVLSKNLRVSAWQQLDNNNNGIVSLAETGKFIQVRLKTFYAHADNKCFGVSGDEAMRLYKLFYPCFIRAFLDAADYGPASKVTQAGGGKVYGNTKTSGDDFVQFKEFRLLVTYLCIYGTIFEAFGNVDGGGKGVDATDDRRISLDEWKTHCATLKGHPLLSLSISGKGDPATVFGAMDADGKGKVLLGEFSKYVEDFEFALKSRWGKILNAGEPVVGSAGQMAAASSS